MTRITIAALPIVEATDGMSVACQLGYSFSLVQARHLHIPTMFPATLLPKDRYPVMATKT